MKYLIIVLILSSTLSLIKSDSTCQLTDIHYCFTKFHNLPEKVDSLCNNVEYIKQCMSEYNCCDEYEKKHCLKVIDRLSVWKNHYGLFTGCEKRVCECSKEKVGIESNHYEDDNYYYNSSCGLFFMLFMFLYIYLIL